jgi:putative transposase
VSAETKLELLGLIDSAVKDGWAHTRACRVLDLADVRAHRWRQRLRETGSLQDGRPVGDAVHRLLVSEEQAILDLIEQWGWVDRSHRKLAHRGSYTETVFVSPSTLLRVALKHRVQLPGEPFRSRPQMPVFPEVPWERNRIWIWDATHFTRSKRVAYAIIDVVTRYWIGYLADQPPGAAAVRPRTPRSGPARRRRLAAGRPGWAADPGRVVRQRARDDRDRHKRVHGVDDDHPASRPARHPD